MTAIRETADSNIVFGVFAVSPTLQLLAECPAWNTVGLHHAAEALHGQWSTMLTAFSQPTLSFYLRSHT
jgi:hypothetical protein